jgi:hypothetical protein
MKERSSDKTTVTAKSPLTKLNAHTHTFGLSYICVLNINVKA